ncbi:MAG: phosphotransferase [Frankiaceae bacterium]|nr:phosphotransferase [Frankiaceae bacterium]
MAGYLELSDAEQVEALRPVALEAADRFGLEVAGLQPVIHAYNTTFAVDTVAGRRYALRVGTNSSSTAAHVLAQQEWQRAIAAGTDVVVAEPLTTTGGGWFAEVASPAIGRPLLVTAASWLDGPDVGVDLSPEVAHALGRTMALLHRQAETWELPAGGEMPTFDTPLFGDDDLLADTPGLTTERREVLDRAREETGRAFARLHQDGAGVRALHADLHGDNVKWHRGRLAVFDFDDCGLGLPVLDLAVSTFYLRGGDPAAEQAMRAGYAQVAPLPDVDPAWFEAVVAARQLLLNNALLSSSTAELRAEAADYLVVGTDRLRRWLTTGTFRREVCG